jgi:hypothetical protein
LLSVYFGRKSTCLQDVLALSTDVAEKILSLPQRALHEAYYTLYERISKNEGELLGL